MPHIIKGVYDFFRIARDLSNLSGQPSKPPLTSPGRLQPLPVHGQPDAGRGGGGDAVLHVSGQEKMITGRQSNLGAVPKTRAAQVALVHEALLAVFQGKGLVVASSRS